MVQFTVNPDAASIDLSAKSPLGLRELQSIPVPGHVSGSCVSMVRFAEIIFVAMLNLIEIRPSVFSYIPGIQSAFGTRGIAAEYFFLPMAYGVVLLFLDETRKFFNRRYPQSYMSRVAW